MTVESARARHNTPEPRHKPSQISGRDRSTRAAHEPSCAARGAA